MPKLGIDDSSPAVARSRWRSVCSVGMRNAAPLMKTFAHSVAVNAITSIDQRRMRADGLHGHASIVAQPSQHIELAIPNIETAPVGEWLRSRRMAAH